MLGEFMCRVLVMIVGYAYPAFQCFRAMEDTSRVDIDHLRFWCQYWIIVALLSVCEKFGDIFISWVPLYDELKLAFIIYLWHPRTRGTSYVYETFLRPLVSSHETDVDKVLKDLRLRAWDLAIYYWQNCTELGQGAFVEVVHYLLTLSQRFKSGNINIGVPLPHPHPQNSEEGHRRRGGLRATEFAPPHHGSVPDPPSGPFRRGPPQPSAPPMRY